MDRLQKMAAFVAVAEEGGFAAAARRLGISAPAVTRAVASLEKNLGVRLLDRTTRQVRVSDMGLQYLEDCRRILSSVESAEEAVANNNAEPRGQLSVTAPIMFGQLYVMPIITRYLELYPGTSVNAVFVDRVVKLLQEGIDVAIRVGELPDSNLRAIRVGSVRLCVCGSARYFNDHQRPEHPFDLPGHAIVLSRALNTVNEWQFQSGGNNLCVRLKPRLITTNNSAAIRAVVEGFGVTRLISYQVADKIQSGEIELVLEEFEPEAIPIHIVHQQGRLASSKVRAFIDLMTEMCEKHKELNLMPGVT